MWLTKERTFYISGVSLPDLPPVKSAPMYYRIHNNNVYDSLIYILEKRNGES